MELHFILLLLPTLSVSSQSGFHYRLTFNVLGIKCQLCFKHNCLLMDPARCQYYAKTDRMGDDSASTGADLKMKYAVDEVMFEFVEKASETEEYECIPYVSQYTDCSKENICLGCQSCHCTGEGQWDCSATQDCRRDGAALDVDHRVLVSVIERLMTDELFKDNKIRRIRSFVAEPADITTRKVGLVDISEWLYGVKPFNYQSDSSINAKNDSERTTPQQATESTETRTEITFITDADSLAFEEVLKSIAVDNKNITRRKPPLGPLDTVKNDTVFDIDLILLDIENSTSYNFNTTDFVPDLLKIIDDIDTATEKTKEASGDIIDLLETAKSNKIEDDFNTTDFDSYLVKYNENIIVDTNDIENNSVNIMKRDTFNDQNTTDFINITTESQKPINSTEHKCGCKLNETVLMPLHTLTNKMERGCAEFKKIKENMAMLLKSTNLTLDKNHSGTNNIYSTLGAESFEFDTRRQNSNILEKLVTKLKRDIYEVVRGIMLIQKQKSTAELPNDLKLLIHAMKHFIRYHKKKFQKFDINMDKLHSDRTSKNYRRHEINPSNLQTPKDYIMKILNIIDKPMPISKALDYLSHTTRKVVKRIIKKYYNTEEWNAKAHSSIYNFTTDLKSIQSDWVYLNINLEKYWTLENLYSMKLLHFVLSEDMNKLGDAIKSFDLTQNRRKFKRMGPDEVEKITTGLQAINNKVKLLLQIHKNITTKPIVKSNNHVLKYDDVSRHGTDKLPKKKKSFFKQVVNLLKNSKNAIKDLLRKKVPKTEIIRQIAKSKLSELQQKRYAQYEETMKKWQKNLDIKSRKKRDTHGFVARMKSIIPNYLRGKVHRVDSKNNNGIKSKQQTIRKGNRTERNKHLASYNNKSNNGVG